MKLQQLPNKINVCFEESFGVVELCVVSYDINPTTAFVLYL